MKKLILSVLLLGAVTVSAMAQDDLYFTPGKTVKKSKSSYEVIDDSPAYHSGSNRDVDEYNRRGKFGSYFTKIGTDSLGNDIIEFHTSAEDVIDTLAIYPGTNVEYNVDDDYTYSRRMSRFDDYYWYDPWLYSHYGFGPYWRYYRHVGFYDPWYDPWYFGGWYDPWYYSYYGWYDPWYYGYGYYGWGYPYRYYGGYAGYYGSWAVPVSFGRGGNIISGSGHHGAPGRPGTTVASRGNYGGYRGNGQTTSAYNRSQARSVGTGVTNGGGRFGNNRSYSNSNTSTRSYTPSYSGGTSTRSGGGFSGGSGGGGSTRSSGGGGHFGGRR